MKHTKLLGGVAVSALALGLLWGCNPSTESEVAETQVEAESVDMADIAANNPLLAEWDTPYGIPTFDAFSDDDYLPAIEYGIMQMREDIAAIESNDAAPTFENTIVALENAGAELNQAAYVFSNITNTESNDKLRDLEGKIWPMLTKESDAVYLSDAIWERVKTVYNQRDDLGLDQMDMRLLELTHRDFVRSGADLDADAKARMKEINARLSELTTQFGQNQLAETKAFKLVLDEDELQGLSDSLIGIGKKAAEAADMPDKWVFGLNRAVYEDFMTQSENRDAREKLFYAYTHRGDNGNEYDNGPLVIELARLRAEAANLRGYDSHAQYQLETRMAKTPELAEEFLLKVWRPGLEKAKVELLEMQALVGDDYSVDAHDWWHLAEKVRQDKYAFDDNQLKPYFQLDAVREGAFETAEKLFGVSFTELTDVPVWNDVVTAYDVRNENGEHLGVFMMDMYARDSKRGGAWMSSYRTSDGDTRPIITNNLNLSVPPEGEPTLLAFGQVNTLFHEFGHGLHGLMSQVRYSRYSGTSGPRDYTEFPAQMMEHWAADPQVLADYAKHVDTGVVIPAELMEKMRAASNHNQGFATTEFIAASLLDLRWHMLSVEEAEAITDATAFENEVLAEYGLIDEIRPRYRSQYFSHIFAGGYSAGYYAYLWSEILDSDGFEAFKEAGDIYDPELAARLKKHVYESGGLEDADVLYRKFRGKDPTIEPLLKKRGLASGT